MRIQLLSDLHLEFHRDGGESFASVVPVRAEVLVLAGDVTKLIPEGAAVTAFGWFCARFQDVVFVPGNHEYYGSSPAEGAAVLAAVGRRWPNFHVLNPGVVELGGVRFVGASLWFPHLAGEENLRGFLNDFASIRDFVPWVHEANEAHVAWLAAQVRPGDVVVTHHLPHPESVAPRYRGSPLTRFFVAANAAPLVTQLGAKLWLHGHTHEPCDYVVGATRVVCNPLGYPHEQKAPCDVGLVLEA